MPEYQSSTSIPCLKNTRLGWVRFLPLFLVIVGSLAYAGSFSGSFLLDDEQYIVRNSRIQQLWPPSGLAQSRRPVVDFTLALNYAHAGLKVESYHAFNLIIHLLAGLTLFGVVGRTFSRSAPGMIGDRRAYLLALVVAILWVLHPLQTQSVTYIVQRCESLMGLFYLLTLYCVIRGVGSNRSHLWYAAAIVVSTLGMGSKAVMVTAPVVVFLYDGVFLSRSWWLTIHSRWGLYIGLAATWSVLWFCGVAPAVLDPSASNSTVGFGFRDISPVAYALTQPEVILRYLTLSFWPYPLCLDYGWPVVGAVADAAVPGVVVGLLLAGTILALVRRSWVGFLGAWFFLILAPTSSIIPIRDVLFEHRMYLPLAAIVVLVVVGSKGVLVCLSGRLQVSDRVCTRGAMIAVVAVSLSLAFITYARNRLYQDPVSMWADVVAKRPTHARAHENMGCSYHKAGDLSAAKEHFHHAIRLFPTSRGTHFNLGTVLCDEGLYFEGIEAFRQEVRLDPKHTPARISLGNALAATGHLREAISEYRLALDINPKAMGAWVNMGNALASIGRTDEAIEALRKAIQIEPLSADLQYNLGNVFLSRGENEEALAAYRQALRLNREHGRAYVKLASLLLSLGRSEEGIAMFGEAVAALPEDAKLHLQLGVALTVLGRLDEAAVEFRDAILLDSDQVEAHVNLGNVLAATGKIDEAEEAYRLAIDCDPRSASAYLRLGHVLLKQGRRGEAIDAYSEVLKIRPGYAAAQMALQSALNRGPVSGAP